MRIATYRYVYGIGYNPNREIVFSEEKGQIKATVRVFSPDSPHHLLEISIIQSDQLEIDLLSTTEKIRQIPKSVIFPKISNPSNLKSYLNQLEPKGPWEIEVTNDIGDKSSILEKVTHLTLFNPS